MKTVFFFLLLLLAAGGAFLFGITVGVGWDRGRPPVLATVIIILGAILLLLWFGLRLGVRHAEGKPLRRALIAALIVTGLVWSFFALALVFRDHLPPRPDGRAAVTANDVRIMLLGLLALGAAWLLIFRGHWQLRQRGENTQREVLEAFD